MVDLPSEIELDREQIHRKGLHEFVRRAWHIVEPSVAFVDNQHIAVACRHIECCIAGETEADRNLIVNIPPGTCKSLLFSVFLPAWIWTIWPGFCSIYASFDIDISRRDATRTLMILKSQWYRERWPDVRLRETNPAVTGFYNTAGGFRFATSVESNVTGWHADLKVVDDPIKPLDTMGGKENTAGQIEKVQTWWDGTMTTRNKDPKKARYCIIMQRLCEGDLAGYLLKKDKGHCTHLCLPMRFVPETACFNANVGMGDWRTKEGELLFPDRFDEEAVAKLERDLGIHAPAQLQQDPTNPDGEIFKKTWLKFYDSIAELPRFYGLSLSVDCTFKKTTGSDFVALQLWGRNGPNHYLLFEWSDRMSFTENLAAIRRICAGNVACLLPNYRVGAKLVEDKANGSAVMDVLTAEISGLIPVEPAGGKIARANAVSYLHEAGNVFYPNPKTFDSPWITPHINQMLGFPRARKDDSVDAETQYLHWASMSGSNMWAALEAHKQKVAQDALAK
jgi:predicted phage terminase large subunit-like protein